MSESEGLGTGGVRTPERGPQSSLKDGTDHCPRTRSGPLWVTVPQSSLTGSQRPLTPTLSRLDASSSPVPPDGDGGGVLGDGEGANHLW